MSKVDARCGAQTARQEQPCRAGLGWAAKTLDAGRTAQDSLNGRIPDLVVTTGSVADDTVWLAPEAVALAVEIVSKGSERTDRWTKHVEYAEAGIPRHWRVEPDDIVLRFRIDGNRYVEDGSTPLDDLLAGDVPDLF